MCDEQNFRSACAYAQSDQSLCLSLEYSMSVKLRTEHHLEFLSLKGGCTGSSESTLMKMPHCWKSHVTARSNIFRVEEPPMLVSSTSGSESDVSKYDREIWVIWDMAVNSGIIGLDQQKF